MPYEITDKGRDLVQSLVDSGQSNVKNAYTTILRVALREPEDLEMASTTPVFDRVIEELVEQGYLVRYD